MVRLKCGQPPMRARSTRYGMKADLPGAVSDEITEQALANRQICTGKAGSVCKMTHGAWVSTKQICRAMHPIYMCICGG